MRLRRRLLLAALPFALIATACGGDSASPDNGTADPAAADDETTSEASDDGTEAAGTIRIGFIPGPYADLFRGGIAPILEEQGYEVDIQEISDFTIPNQATMADELDMTVFQNDAFMELFNSENDGDLVALLKIPSAPLGLYPGRGTASTPEEIEDGAVMAITSEASNMARSLSFLETLGLVEVGEVDEGAMATARDLASNPKNLSFEPVDAPQVPRALPDVDYGIALGNHIYAAGDLTLADAIALEEVPEASQITVTLREENADTDWAQVVQDAFRSQEFREFVESDENFASFHKPDWW